MKINSIKQDINFKSGQNQLIPLEKVVFNKIKNIKKLGKNSGIRKVLVQSVINDFRKDISYLAYKNMNISNSYSEIINSLTEKIIEIIDSKKSSNEILQEIKNLLKNDKDVKGKRYIIPPETLNMDLLSPAQKNLINQVSQMPLKDVIKQNNSTLYKTQINVNAAIYKSQRRSGHIPENIVEFTENYKKAMGIKANDDDKIYKMIEERYDILSYKNRLNILRENADLLCERYKKYNVTKDEWNNIFYSMPELICYSPKYVVSKIESNVAEFEKENIPKDKFFTLAKYNTDLFSMKSETIKQKFADFKSMFKKYNIDYSNFPKMLDKFPEIFQRNPEKMFLSIDKLEKLLNSKAFNREKYIKAVTKYPALLSTTPERFVEHINKTVEALQEYDVTKDDYIKACLFAPTVLNITDKKIVEKINEIEKRFASENFDKRKFIKGALKKSTILAYTPEKLESNIDDFVKIYEKYGLTRKRYLDCAIKVPSLFTRNPETISNNITKIINEFSDLGLTTQVFINNFDSNAILLSLDPDNVIKKIKIYYQILSESYKSNGLSKDELWDKILKRNITYSQDRIFLTKLNYKMFPENPFGKNNEFKIAEIIKENPDKTYKIKLSDNELDREFAEYLKDFSQKNAGKNVFNIEFENKNE